MINFWNWFFYLEGVEYVEFAMLVLTVVGGIFALIQWRCGNKIKRAEFINGLIEEVRSDKEISKTIYLFDYDANWYSSQFHNGKNGLEHEVDKTLSFFSYICYLRNNNLISKRDFEFFDYEIRRIADNYSVQAYLYNLYHFSENRNTKMSFCYLFDYCYKNKLFGENKEMKNSASTYYPHYLNF